MRLVLISSADANDICTTHIPVYRMISKSSAVLLTPVHLYCWHGVNNTWDSSPVF